MVVVIFIQLYNQNSHFSYSAALCSDPPTIVNGMMTFSGNSVNDTATYSCNSGFELIGDSTMMCTQNDANSAEFLVISPPVCRREYFIKLEPFSIVK